jgi:hypothetical protein
MEYFDLGSAPADERCAQLGVDNDYETRARRECRALIHQFTRVCGDPPPGARFRIVANPHDFGTYYSVVVEYDPSDSEAVAYACRCDDTAPARWDDAARLELDAGRTRDCEREAAS